jgi:hypothetical protein
MWVLISVVSVKGSPGVTTAALALGSVWPRTALVVDVDPQGGDVLAGVGGGRQAADRGIVDVLTEARHGDPRAALSRHVTRPAPHAPLLLAGFGAPGQAARVPWTPLAEVLDGLPETDVLADCGRYTPTHPVGGLLRRSRFTMVVTGSSLRAVRSAARGLPLLRAELGLAVDDDESIGLLVVGPDRPYGVGEIEQACHTELLGTLPHDPAAAAVWTDARHPGRSFRRSSLQRAAVALADELTDRLTTDTTPADSPSTAAPAPAPAPGRGAAW